MKQTSISAMAAIMGRRGGKTRVKNQTPDQRKESARHAAKTRWAKWAKEKEKKTI